MFRGCETLLSLRVVVTVSQSTGVRLRMPQSTESRRPDDGQPGTKRSAMGRWHAPSVAS